jgi:DNA-binding NarL/FixJ family response regulator
MTLRVVLGEDNVLVREGVRALLDSYDDIEVVGVAADAPSLLIAADEHAPDVVVTDVKMPPNFQLEGIDCAHTIRDRHPGTGVVVLSAHDDEAYAIALLGKGQSGLAYLLKDRIAQGTSSSVRSRGGRRRQRGRSGDRRTPLGPSRDR